MILHMTNTLYTHQEVKDVIVVYSTRSVNQAFRQMKAYLRENKVPFQVREIHKDPELFWWNDYRRLLEGLAFGNGTIGTTAADLLTSTTPQNVIDFLDSLTDIEATMFLRDNMKYMKSCITYDTEREVALSGFIEDDATVFLKRSTKRKNRARILRKAKKVTKELQKNGYQFNEEEF